MWCGLVQALQGPDSRILTTSSRLPHRAFCHGRCSPSPPPWTCSSETGVAGGENRARAAGLGECGCGAASFRALQGPDSRIDHEPPAPRPHIARIVSRLFCEPEEEEKVVMLEGRISSRRRAEAEAPCWWQPMDSRTEQWLVT